LEEDPYIPEGSGEDADGVGVTPRSTINSDPWTELLGTFGSAGSVLSVLLNAIQSWLERRQRDIETIELNGALRI
jgi:hypothetical protein